MEIKLPTFLIVGAAKSGTSSLYHYLKQHPEIYMPQNKEPRFFASSYYKNLSIHDPRYDSFCRNTVFSFEDYIELFKDVKKQKAIGEATTSYLYFYENTIPQITQFLEDVKIIMILRNPIDRAFSAFGHLSRDLYETLTFEEALELEGKRMKEKWSMLHFYRDVGFYYNQVKAYKKVFSQVKIYLHDDLKDDTLGLVKEIYEFLQVDFSFVPHIGVKYNRSAIPQYKFIQRYLLKHNKLKKKITPFLNLIRLTEKIDNLVEYAKIKNVKNDKKIEMKPETRNQLKNIYREDILKLQDLICRDLTHWL